MNKWWWLFLLMLCWAGTGLAIFGVPRDEASSGTSVPNRPDRIVSMSPNLTEILFALGLEEKIVGVTVRSDYPPAATNKPKIGTFWQPNIEAVIAARPALVITLGFAQQRNLAQRLRRMGCNTLTVDIERVGELFEAIRKIGSATARQRKADKLVRHIRQKLDRLSALVGMEPKVRVLWVIQREPLRVAGTDTFVNEMIELAGGENAIGPTVHKYPPIGAEQVIGCGADVIIEPTMRSDDAAGQRNRAMEYWSKFRNLPAMKNGAVYVIRGETVSRLGPRLYDGVEVIARCLRPGLFEN